MNAGKVDSYLLLIGFCIVFPFVEAASNASQQEGHLSLIKSFDNQNKLQKAAQQFDKRGINTKTQQRVSVSSYYRLEFGPFRLKSDADSLIDSIRKNGFDASVLQRKFDSVIVLGQFKTESELNRQIIRAKENGYNFLKGHLVEDKVIKYDLYAIIPQNSTQNDINTVKEILNKAKNNKQFQTKAEALTALRQLNKNNKEKSSVIQNRNSITDYYFGPYTNFKSALQFSNKFTKAGVKFELVWDKRLLGYIIKISNTKNLSMNELIPVSIINTLGEPNANETIQITYEVITKPFINNLRRENQQNNNQLANSTKTSSANKKSVLQTLSDSRAKQKVEQLRRKGIASEVRQKTEDVELQALLLTDIDTWAKARKISKQLKKLGIDAFPVSNRHDKHFAVTIGYSVSVGIYQNKQNIKNQLKKIRQLGYGNVDVVNYTKEITSYDVIAENPNKTTSVTDNFSTNIPEEDLNNNFSDEESKSSLFDNTEDEEMLVFLDSDSIHSESYQEYSDESDEIEQKNYRFSLDQISTAYHTIPERDDVDSVFTSRIDASTTAKINDNWDTKLSITGKVWQQQGSLELQDNEVLLNDAYIRYRGEDYRITLGSQKVLWGRLDGDAPTDLMSTRDLSFLVLDTDLTEQRLSDTSLRIEGYFEKYKLDFVYTPTPNATNLPDKNSVYAFINPATGRVLGIEPLPIIEQLARLGSVEESKDGDSAFGFRVSYAGESIDFGVTAQQTRIPTPTYSINPDTLALLFLGNTVNDSINLTPGDTFLAFQPSTSVFGGDFSYVEGASTFRGEFSWISDYPVIRESTLNFETTAAVSWGVGLETYPGSTEDTRVILQMVGTTVLDDEDVLGDVSSLGLNGQIETFFFRDKLRSRINFLFNLNKKDIFLNPELSYTGITNHEFYISYYFFQGNDDTLGGFFDKSDTLSIGWKGTFN